MKFRLLSFAMSGVFITFTAVAPNNLQAQNPPAGYIFDLANTSQHASGTALTSYTQFNTSFIADNSSEYVSFAFREVPAFFAFDDASVTQSGSTTNLLADPGFETASYGQNCNHTNSLGCPTGWGAWIQPVDVTAIGQVATNGDTYGCNVGGHSGTNFWCDGSVEGLDAVYQQVSRLTVGSTYSISWWLQDDSGSAITTPDIDMWVYAGDAIPVGTIPIGTSTPEPASVALFGFGLLAVGFVTIRRISPNSVT